MIRDLAEVRSDVLKRVGGEVGHVTFPFLKYAIVGIGESVRGG